MSWPCSSQPTVWGWLLAALFDVETLLHIAEKIDDPHWAKYGVAKIRFLQPVIQEEEDRVNRSVAAIEMLAQPSVKAAVLSLRDALYDLVHTANAYPPRECGGWSQPLVEADESLEASRNHFIHQTRSEFGIKD